MSPAVTTDNTATRSSSGLLHKRKKRKKKKTVLAVKTRKKEAKSGDGGTKRRYSTPAEYLRARSRDKMSPAEWKDAYDVRLREAMAMTGTSHKKLAEHIIKPKGEPLGRSGLSAWVNRYSRPGIDQLKQVETYFKTYHPGELPEGKDTAQWFAYGVDTEPVKVLPDTDELGYHIVPEVDVKGPEKRNRHQVSNWGLERHFIVGDLGVRSIKDIVIVRASEDSQGIEFGDRMLVDCSDAAREPSPPGKFLIWNGFSVSVATITLLPLVAGRRPKVKVVMTSGQAEADPDKVDIVGRIRGVWKKV